jgi:hypothetical protein
VKGKRNKEIVWMVLTAIILSTIVCLVTPLAAQGPSSTVTPISGVSGVPDSYDVLINTTPISSICITIPAGFRAVVPPAQGLIATIEMWNGSERYGLFILTADRENASTMVDIISCIGDDIVMTSHRIDYTPGNTTSIPCGRWGSGVLTLPTDTANGSFCISLPEPMVLTNVAIKTGPYVLNPAEAGEYVFTVGEERIAVDITKMET